MKKAKKGDTVKVHYTGKLKDDEIFDSSEGREPLEFKIGAGRVIPGFEEGVVDMAPGETKTITIPMDKAYGKRYDELVNKVEKSRLPEDFVPEIGMQLEVKQPNGNIIVVTITEMDDDSITIDANHSLAGKDLIFDLELVKIS